MGFARADTSHDGTRPHHRAASGLVLAVALVLLRSGVAWPQPDLPPADVPGGTARSAGPMQPDPAQDDPDAGLAPDRSPGLPALAPAPQWKEYPIDLPTALRLGNAQNPHVLYARERIREAIAELKQAEVLWLPDLTFEPMYHRHDGKIQRAPGDVITTSRTGIFVVGGPEADFALAEAIFLPLAARQFVKAQQANAFTTTNDTLLDVAVAYWEVIRDRAALVINEQTLENLRVLDELSQSYLRAGKLKAADSERVRAEYRLRAQLVELARQRIQVDSIRLARLLLLDPFTVLVPVEEHAFPLALINPDADPNELTALAMENRPELAENRALVAEAAEMMRLAKFRPLLPSIVADYAGGGFGGGRNSYIGDFGPRSDLNAWLIWRLRNLGIGDIARIRQRQSQVRQANYQLIAEVQRVVTQVADAVARSQSTRLQMDIGRLAVESAIRSHEYNYKLFREAGLELIRPIEVLQSVQALERTQMDYLDAIFEYNRAQFRLYWSLGYPVLCSVPDPPAP